MFRKKTRNARRQRGDRRRCDGAHGGWGSKGLAGDEERGSMARKEWRDGPGKEQGRRKEA